MRNKKITLTISAGLGVMLVLFWLGCADMDVTNPNAPDSEAALAEGDDVESLIGGAFLSFWNGTMKNYPQMTLSVMGGGITSSWGNFGMLDLGKRPREHFINDDSYGDVFMARTPWYNLYTAIAAVNTGLQELDEGNVTIAEEERARAFARLIHGLSHGFLALHFDQAFIVDENLAIDLDDIDATVDGMELRPYNEVMDAAIGYLEDVITIASQNSFTFPGSWINGNALTETELIHLCHAWIARFKAQVARTPAEREAVDWASVVDHAQLGLQFGQDFIVQADGVIWWSRSTSLMQDPVWTRVSYYTVGHADNSGQFQEWLDTPPLQREEFVLETDDERFGTEITYYEPLPAGKDFALTFGSFFAAERGSYFFSRYYHVRYIMTYLSGYVGPMNTLNQTELDLLIAEGEIRLERDLGLAAEMINNTRVNRGGLPEVTAGDGVEVLLDAMKYEHRLETLNTFVGVDFYTRRGWGELPDNTPLHFPVPSRELIRHAFDVYTFGGERGEEGSDRANFGFPKIDPQILTAEEKDPPRI